MKYVLTIATLLLTACAGPGEGYATWGNRGYEDPITPLKRDPNHIGGDHNRPGGRRY